MSGPSGPHRPVIERRIETFIEAIMPSEACPDPYERIKASGLTPREIDQVESHPDIERTIFRESYKRIVIPSIPQLLYEIVQSALAPGEKAVQARKQLLSLVGDKSIVESKTGNVLMDLTEEELVPAARQIVAQFQDVLRKHA